VSRRRGILYVAAGALLWSTGGVAIKAVAAPPLTIAGWRSAIAAGVSYLLLRPGRPKLTPAFLVALVCYAGCLPTFVVATKWTTAANAILLQYSGVVWILLLSPVVLGEPFQPRDAVAVVVAFLGMVLCMSSGLSGTGRAGDVVALVSGVLYAGLVLSLRHERDRSASASIVWGNVVIALMLLPETLGGPIPTLEGAAILLFLGAVQIACAYALFLRGLREVTAAQASLAGMLEPITNPIWVLLVLGESPSPNSIAGGLVVLAAIAWRTVTLNDTPAPVPPPD
jgi:drug/metabolite transporter (DMT)-like permease